MQTKTKQNIRALCEGALMVALAQILGYLKFFGSMLAGGSITFAMFPICFYAVRWGWKKGLLAGFAFGLLQLLLDGAYAWGWQSMLLDYLLAFTPLGLAGLFKSKPWGIFPGIAVGCTGRFIIHYISGVTIYRMTEPSTLPLFGTIDNAELYSFLYNGMYLIPCTVLALVAAAVLFKPLKKYFTGADIQ